MKIFVRTLKGARFEIQVNPEDSVADVKKKIETVLGATASYPAAEQVLIHKGKVLKDETTVEANNVSEKSIIGVMKRKPASIGTSTSTETAGLSIDVTPTEPASAGASYVSSERVSESSIQNILGMEYLYFGTEDQSQEPETPEEADQERLPDSLNDTPEHEYLRAKVQSDPSMVKEFVERLEEQDPAMFQLIQDKKAVFLLLLKVEGGACGNEMEQPHELEAEKTNEPDNGVDGGNQVGETEETEVEQHPQEHQAEQTNEPNNGGDGGNQVVEEFEDKGCTSPC